MLIGMQLKQWETQDISWSHVLRQGITRGKSLNFDDGQLVRYLYRPFTKRWLYFSGKLNEAVHQMPKILPDEDVENRMIGVTGKGG